MSLWSPVLSMVDLDPTFAVPEVTEGTGTEVNKRKILKVVLDQIKYQMPGPHA